MSALSATVEADIDADQSAVFEHIVPVDLVSIFTGYGPLPAVINMQDQTGAWDAAGQTRTVLLSDGSSAQEMLTRYGYPHYFGYTVSGFTGVLRWLSSSANGEWWFNGDVSLGKTHIKWRYEFNAKSVFAAPVLWLVANLLWRGYMNKALALAKLQVESAAERSV